MARNKTQNLPDLSALLTPKNSLMLAVERAVLRGQDWATASAPIADQIAARLAGVITLDLVKSGQRLLETDISEVLHVSRSPVREAMRILERDRLVEFQSRRGAIVTSPDEHELRDIFHVRSVLYVTMLEQVARENPAELEALLTTHLPKLIKAADESADAYAVESFLLNFTMVSLCSNRLLVDLLHSISLRTLRYVRLGFVAEPRAIRTSLRDWRALQKAAVQRDNKLLLSLAIGRLDEARDTAVRAIVEKPASGRRSRATTATKSETENIAAK
ncbi:MULTISPECIES: GntR family transcriptional regulator [Pandoraea]|uniref:GntR family transcriptional regulator n=1 Tax=Pandoraea TaxID=93217 RepID=UPI0003C76A86|nr:MULTISPECIES: GntR family transcriptional regulator [Pandoraea]AHB74757.1 GntR family transcriptional regulator [Pandoraea pnomenusa]AHN76871.1 GntR family transcriptional regulator [Pandoraea pnomenusa]